MGNAAKTASFGFRDVDEDEKEGLVREVFSSVARRYDLMNDLMSGGIHRLWKDAFVEWLNPQPGWQVLDVAGGTGDIAFRIAEMARARGGDARVTVCDINPDMVAEGVRRAAEKGERAIAWVCGDAEKLPVPDASQDAYTIAFGIRNVTHIDRALAEAARVLKPGGRLLGATLAKHAHRAAVAPFDHRNLGFKREELIGFARKAGLEVLHCAKVAREARPPHFEVLSLLARKST